jgi:hypothetical protein
MKTRNEWLFVMVVVMLIFCLPWQVQSAQKGRDQIIKVSNNQSTSIGGNQTISVGGNRNVTVGAADVTQIGRNQSITVGTSRTVTVGSQAQTNVGAHESTNIGATLTLTVGVGEIVRIGKNHAITIGSDRRLDVGGNRAENASRNYNIRAILIEAGNQITLKTGKAMIILKKNGDIIISGKNISVRGSGNVGINCLLLCHGNFPDVISSSLKRTGGNLMGKVFRGLHIGVERGTNSPLRENISERN